MTAQRREVDEDLYEQETDIEHVFNRPDMILSTDEWVERDVPMYDFETGKIIKKNTNVPPAVFQLVVEAIANAGDHIHRSRVEGFPERLLGLPSIEVTMDRYTISVKNYGLAMPISVHKKYKVPTPQFLFGNLRSSSNYKGTRTGIGRNGYGIKAANIFGEPFEVYIVNIEAGSSYYQKWWNKMNEFSEPIIKSLEKDEIESSVKISYRLNFKRFKFDEEGYPNDFFCMVAHLVQSLSFTKKINTQFNDLIFTNQHILDYATHIYSDEALESALIHYELDWETEEVTKIDGRPTPSIRKGKPFHIITPKAELLIIDPSGVSKQGIESFANGMPTDSGVHVDALLEQIVPKIVKRINEVKRKDDKKGVKSKGKTALATKNIEKNTAVASKTVKSVRIKAVDVKPSITSLLSVHVINPKFDSQIKSRLCSPAPVINISDEKLEPIFKWKFMDRLDAILHGLELRAMSRTDGRKVGFIKVESGFDANDAGKRNWKDCVLIIVEGLSAMGYAVEYISNMTGGRDKYGVLPFRGKLLNTRKASIKRIVDNKEISNLKQFLGIKEGQNSLEGLRYGKVMIMTDADDDGSHIKGLIANVFDHLYPDLLELGYIIDYRTKYLQAVKGQKKESFYTEYEFREWKEVTPNWKTWKFSFFKGLGTSETEDIIQDAKNPKIMEITYDENARKNFEMLFGKTKADERKEWLEKVRHLKYQPYILPKTITYSDFFDREFSNYALMALRRAIPSMTDGLKHCHRQILWGVMSKWKGAGPYEIMKVAQLANHVATVVAYHHGELSLACALVIMARSFMGSNNLALLEPKGQFGTRILGGADAASTRYINTRPSKWLYQIFRKEDIPILDRIEDEGKLLEPKTFYPIIPIGIINGISGVATGYSTSVLNYNPRDVTDYVIWWINKTFGLNKVNAKTPEILPSYVGFTGSVTLYKDAPYDSNSNLFMGEGVNDEVMSDESLFQNSDKEERELLKPSSPSSYGVGNLEQNLPYGEGEEDEIVEEEIIKCDRVEFTGTYEYNERESTVKVTELPPGRWSVNYNRWLQDQKIKKKIQDFKDRSSTTRANFLITGITDPSPQKLNLVKSIRLSNMVFLDIDGIPVKYKTIQDYIEDFCKFRIKMYERRKDNQLKEMENSILRQNERLKFIEAVINEEIIVTKRPKKDVKEDMEKLKFNPDLYDDVKLSELGEDGLESCKNNIKKTTEERELYMSIAPAMIWKKELMELSRLLKREKSLDRLHEIEIRFSKKTIK